MAHESLKHIKYRNLSFVHCARFIHLCFYIKPLNKVPAKNASEMASAYVIYYIYLQILLTYVRVKATIWNQIRLLLYEQFDLGLHCLTKRLLKHLDDKSRIFFRLTL